MMSLPPVHTGSSLGVMPSAAVVENLGLPLVDDSPMAPASAAVAGTAEDKAGKAGDGAAATNSAWPLLRCLSPFHIK